jgi:hypothetical protein
MFVLIINNRHMKSAHRVQSRIFKIDIDLYLDKILFEMKIEIGTDCFRFVATFFENPYQQ